VNLDEQIIGYLTHPAYATHLTHLT